MLAVLIASLYPPYGHKVGAESGQPVNPALEGKADTPLPGTPENPTAISKGAKDLTAGLRSLDVLSVPPPRTETIRRTQSRPEAVLGLIHYPWQQLGYEVVFLPARAGFRAMTMSERHRIEIYMRSGDRLRDTAYDVAHELGHAFDLEYNDEDRHSRWCVLRGIDPSTPWFGCNRCPDYDTPAGDFAETFAFLLLGPGNYHSLMAAPPNLDEIPQLAAFCHIESKGLWYAKRLAQAN